LRDEHGNTPLWTAVFNAKGDYVIVEQLIQASANPNSQNRHGRSPLDFARQIKDRDLISILEDTV
jgi:ankyrin repeat protein